MSNSSNARPISDPKGWRGAGQPHIPPRTRRTISREDARRRDLAYTIASGVAAVLVVVLAIVGYCSSRPHFIVPPGGNLISELGYSGAIDAAEHWNLPIYAQTIGQSAQTITPEEARDMRNRTDFSVTKVVVVVQPGDRFDFRWGAHYWPNTPEE